MVSTSVATSSFGRWEMIVQQTYQNQGGNYSHVRVRGILHRSGPGTSYNNNNIAKAIRGTNSWDGSGGFSITGTASQTIIDVTFTVYHNSAGYATVNYSMDYGNTGTSAFGDPPSLSLSLTLTRIPKPPGVPPSFTRTFTAPRTIKYSWGAAATNGSTVNQYQLQVANNSAFTSGVATYATTGRSYSFTAPKVGYIVYARVRAHNGAGWGSWSSGISYDIPGLPGTPTMSPLVYTPATTVTATCNAVSGDGVSIVRYEFQYADNANFTAAKLTATANGNIRTVTVSDVTVGKTWYFRARAITSQGTGAWSSAVSVLVVCGPRILVNGVWRNTIAYVRDAGVWKVAVPYVRDDGTWKVAGG